MSLLPNEEAVELAVGEALVLAFAGQPDVAGPVAASSIYFGPTDDPRAPRPACRLFEVSQVDLGRETMHAVPQLQAWSVQVLGVAEAPYTISIRGELHTYDGQPGDETADIVAGLVAAVAGDPNATAVPGVGVVLVEALEPGVSLALATTPNLDPEITRDRGRWQGGTSAERTYAFNFASVMSPTAPSPKQHANTYAKLWRGRLWHSDVLARLAVVGIAPRRIAAGPTPLDELVDNVTETRAVLEVVFSITAGASSSSPVMESASGSTTLETE